MIAFPTRRIKVWRTKEEKGALGKTASFTEEEEEEEEEWEDSATWARPKKD
jgi:hypothetical protein